MAVNHKQILRRCITIFCFWEWRVPLSQSIVGLLFATPEKASRKQMSLYLNSPLNQEVLKMRYIFCDCQKYWTCSQYSNFLGLTCIYKGHYFRVEFSFATFHLIMNKTFQLQTITLNICVWLSLRSFLWIGLTHNKNTTEYFEECTKGDFTSYKNPIHAHFQNWQLCPKLSTTELKSHTIVPTSLFTIWRK